MSELCACTGLIFCDACTVGMYAGPLCACVMCLAVYMCILSFFSRLHGRSTTGGGAGTEGGNFCWC